MTAREKISALAKNLWHLANSFDYDYVGVEFKSESAYKKAEAEDLQVVLPTDRQLFIDIDNDFSLAVFEKNWQTFANWYTEESDPVITPSKSGGERKHITVTLAEPVTPTERLVLQAFLGSDLKREFLGLQRIKAGDKNPTLFLERKN